MKLVMMFGAACDAHLDVMRGGELVNLGDLGSNVCDLFTTGTNW